VVTIVIAGAIETDVVEVLVAVAGLDVPGTDDRNRALHPPH
jgi:hypothetical protein